MNITNQQEVRIMQTVDIERQRERQMFELFQFLYKRPDIASNEDAGGDNKPAPAQQRNYKGDFDDDFKA